MFGKYKKILLSFLLIASFSSYANGASVTKDFGSGVYVSTSGLDFSQFDPSIHQVSSISAYLNGDFISTVDLVARVDFLDASGHISATNQNTNRFVAWVYDVDANATRGVFFEISGGKLKATSAKWIRGHDLITSATNTVSVVTNDNGHGYGLKNVRIIYTSLTASTNNLVLKSANKVFVKTNITSYDNNTNKFGLTDGNTTHVDYITSQANGKYISYVFQDFKIYQNATIKIFNALSPAFQDNITNSTLQWVLDGNVVSYSILSGTGKSILEYTYAGKFNEVRILFSRPSQNLREIELYGDYANERVPIPGTNIALESADKLYLSTLGASNLPSIPLLVDGLVDEVPMSYGDADQHITLTAQNGNTYDRGTVAIYNSEDHNESIKNSKIQFLFHENVISTYEINDTDKDIIFAQEKREFDAVRVIFHNRTQYVSEIEVYAFAKNIVNVNITAPLISSSSKGLMEVIAGPNLTISEPQRLIDGVFGTTGSTSVTSAQNRYISLKVKDENASIKNALLKFYPKYNKDENISSSAIGTKIIFLLKGQVLQTNEILRKNQRAYYFSYEGKFDEVRVLFNVNTASLQELELFGYYHSPMPPILQSNIALQSLSLVDVSTDVTTYDGNSSLAGINNDITNVIDYAPRAAGGKYVDYKVKNSKIYSNGTLRILNSEDLNESSLIDGASIHWYLNGNLTKRQTIRGSNKSYMDYKVDGYFNEVKIIFANNKQALREVQLYGALTNKIAITKAPPIATDNLAVYNNIKVDIKTNITDYWQDYNLSGINNDEFASDYDYAPRNAAGKYVSYTIKDHKIATSATLRILNRVTAHTDRIDNSIVEYLLNGHVVHSDTITSNNQQYMDYTYNGDFTEVKLTFSNASQNLREVQLYATITDRFAIVAPPALTGDNIALATVDKVDVNTSVGGHESGYGLLGINNGRTTGDYDYAPLYASNRFVSYKVKDYRIYKNATLRILNSNNQPNLINNSKLQWLLDGHIEHNETIHTANEYTRYMDYKYAGKFNEVKIIFANANQRLREVELYGTLTTQLVAMNAPKITTSAYVDPSTNVLDRKSSVTDYANGTNLGGLSNKIYETDYSPRHANGKFVSFKLKNNKTFSKGSVRIYNILDTIKDSQIDGSTLQFLLNGKTVATRYIEGDNHQYMDYAYNGQFNEIKIIFNGDNQDLRELEIYGKASTTTNQGSVSTVNQPKIGIDKTTMSTSSRIRYQNGTSAKGLRNDQTRVVDFSPTNISGKYIAVKVKDYAVYNHGKIRILNSLNPLQQSQINGSTVYFILNGYIKHQEIISSMQGKDYFDSSYSGDFDEVKILFKELEQNLRELEIYGDKTPRTTLVTPPDINKTKVSDANASDINASNALTFADNTSLDGLTNGQKRVVDFKPTNANGKFVSVKLKHNQIYNGGTVRLFNSLNPLQQSQINGSTVEFLLNKVVKNQHIINLALGKQYLDYSYNDDFDEVRLVFSSDRQDLRELEIYGNNTDRQTLVTPPDINKTILAPVSDTSSAMASTDMSFVENTDVNGLRNKQILVVDFKARNTAGKHVSVRLKNNKIYNNATIRILNSLNTTQQSEFDGTRLSFYLAGIQKHTSLALVGTYKQYIDYDSYAGDFDEVKLLFAKNKQDLRELQIYADDTHKQAPLSMPSITSPAITGANKSQTPTSSTAMIYEDNTSANGLTNKQTAVVDFKPTNARGKSVSIKTKDGKVYHRGVVRILNTLDINKQSKLDGSTLSFYLDGIKRHTSPALVGSNKQFIDYDGYAGQFDKVELTFDQNEQNLRELQVFADDTGLFTKKARPAISEPLMNSYMPKKISSSVFTYTSGTSLLGLTNGQKDVVDFSVSDARNKYFEMELYSPLLMNKGTVLIYNTLDIRTQSRINGSRVIFYKGTQEVYSESLVGTGKQYLIVKYAGDFSKVRLLFSNNVQSLREMEVYGALRGYDYRLPVSPITGRIDLIKTNKTEKLTTVKFALVQAQLPAVDTLSDDDLETEAFYHNDASDKLYYIETLDKKPYRDGVFRIHDSLYRAKRLNGENYVRFKLDGVIMCEYAFRTHKQIHSFSCAKDFNRVEISSARSDVTLREIELFANESPLDSLATPKPLGVNLALKSANAMYITTDVPTYGESTGLSGINDGKVSGTAYDYVPTNAGNRYVSFHFNNHEVYDNITVRIYNSRDSRYRNKLLDSEVWFKYKGINIRKVPITDTRRQYVEYTYPSGVDEIALVFRRDTLYLREIEIYGNKTTAAKAAPMLPITGAGENLALASKNLIDVTTDVVAYANGKRTTGLNDNHLLDYYYDYAPMQSKGHYVSYKFKNNEVYSNGILRILNGLGEKNRAGLYQSRIHFMLKGKVVDSYIVSSQPVALYPNAKPLLTSSFEYVDAKTPEQFDEVRVLFTRDEDIRLREIQLYATKYKKVFTSNVFYERYANDGSMEDKKQHTIIDFGQPITNTATSFQEVNKHYFTSYSNTQRVNTVYGFEVDGKSYPLSTVYNKGIGLGTQETRSFTTINTGRATYNAFIEYTQSTGIWHITFSKPNELDPMPYSIRLICARKYGGAEHKVAIGSDIMKGRTLKFTSNVTSVAKGLRLKYTQLDNHRVELFLRGALQSRKTNIDNLSVSVTAKIQSSLISQRENVKIRLRLDKRTNVPTAQTSANFDESYQTNGAIDPILIELNSEAILDDTTKKTYTGKLYGYSWSKGTVHFERFNEIEVNGVTYTMPYLTRSSAFDYVGAPSYGLRVQRISILSFYAGKNKYYLTAYNRATNNWQLIITQADPSAAYTHGSLTSGVSYNEIRSIKLVNNGGYGSRPIKTDITHLVLDNVKMSISSNVATRIPGLKVFYKFVSNHQIMVGFTGTARNSGRKDDLITLKFKDGFVHGYAPEPLQVQIHLRD